MVHHLEARQQEVRDQHNEKVRKWEDHIDKGRESALHELGLLLERYKLELGHK